MADEEQPQQQPLERLDVGFDLVTVLRVRQQGPGDEGTERGREACGVHHDGHADHGQQGRRGHGLAHARARDQTEDRRQQIVADAHDRHDGGKRQSSAAKAHRIALDPLGEREQRHQGNQRNGGQILEQQNGERGTAVPRCQLSPLLQHLQRKGGRGERDGKTKKQALNEIFAQAVRDDSEQCGADEKLGPSKAEDRAAHGPEPQGLQFEPDQKEQEHDPELGKMQDVVDLVEGDDEAEAEGSDQEPGRQIAEHGADLEALGKRCRNDRSGQKDGHLNERDLFHLSPTHPRPSFACTSPGRVKPRQASRASF